MSQGIARTRMREAIGGSYPARLSGYADSARRDCGTSGAASVTSVGDRPFSIVSFVTTHFLTSRREGSSNCTSSSVSSMIERRPRAPVSRASAFSATETSASSEKTSSMPSKEKKR